MFWKTVKLKVQSLSLMTKVMLFYSLSTLAILTALCVFLHPLFIKLIQNQSLSVTAECVEKLVIAHLMGFMGAIFFGYVVAKKSLSKLKDFGHKMEGITVDSLDDRINLDEWPKELTMVAKKFNLMLGKIQTPFMQLSQFSSDIAHELRTPINNLMGVTEVALSKKNIDEKEQVILEKYMKEYQYLSKLIENLLFFARSDNGQIQLNIEKVDARKEILNICDYYQAIAHEKEISINCLGEASIYADLVLFKRVINNLVSNAIQYTPCGGEISVLIKPHQSQVEVSIHDNGSGISSEHITKIFDRFYRTDASRSSHTGGLGLGLAMVKSIIDLHKGKIRIESQLNVGTAIYLSLPATS